MQASCSPRILVEILIDVSDWNLLTARNKNLKYLFVALLTRGNDMHQREKNQLTGTDLLRHTFNNNDNT